MNDDAPLTAALCPSWAASLGYMGVASAVVLSNWGSAVSRDIDCLTPGCSVGHSEQECL